ncbi:hypothetical protein DY000_02025259 [Brassica cretica]|uniref:Dirigent protein n=1 Tax=Brassica cretica TaxID=69181 RepID=A0ABQ7ECZ9_BRACR|nr:hypothetical protein DY000_02025259 [Brassica cretica]
MRALSAPSGPAWAWDWAWVLVEGLCQTSYLFSCSLGKLILHPFGDDWTGLGPLIDLSGSNRPRVSGISRSAIVRNGEWKLPRGRHPIILFVHQLPSHGMLDGVDAVFDGDGAAFDSDGAVLMGPVRHVGIGVSSSD